VSLFFILIFIPVILLVCSIIEQFPYLFPWSSLTPRPGSVESSRGAISSWHAHHTACTSLQSHQRRSHQTRPRLLHCMLTAFVAWENWYLIDRN
jgi:hypothetical protein